MGYSSVLSKEYLDFRGRYGTREKLYKSAYGEFTSIVADYVKLTTGTLDIDITSKSTNLSVEALLCEIDYCAYIKLTGNTIIYKKDNYGKVHLLYEYIDSIVYGLGDTVKTMVDQQIPLPKSFITKYNKVYLPRYLEMNYNNIVKIYTDKYHIDYKVIDESLVITMPEFVELLKTTSLRAEDVFTTAIKLDETYRILTRNGELPYTLFDGVADKLYSYTYCVNGKNGERLATKNEKKKMLAGVYKKKECLLPSDKETYVLVGCWLFTGKDKYYNTAKLFKYEGIGDKLLNNLDLIRQSLDYMSTNEFVEEDCKKLLSNKEPDYPDSAEDELEDVKLISMLKVVKKACDPESQNSFIRLAYDIADKAIKNKGHALSEKQLNIMKKVYEQEMAKKNPKPEANETRVNKYDKELQKQMNLLKKKLNNFGFDKTLKDIIQTVAIYKKCSEKQYNLIVNEYNKRCGVEEIKNSGVDEIETKDVFKDKLGSFEEGFEVDFESEDGVPLEDEGVSFDVELDITSYSMGAPVIRDTSPIIDVNKMFGKK